MRYELIATRHMCLRSVGDFIRMEAVMKWSALAVLYESTVLAFYATSLRFPLKYLIDYQS